MLCVYITTLLHYIFTIRLESISYTNVVQGDFLCDRDLWLHFLHCAIFWHKQGRKIVKKNFWVPPQLPGFPFEIPRYPFIIN